MASILRTDRHGCQADEVDDITVTESIQLISIEWPNEGLFVYFLRAKWRIIDRLRPKGCRVFFLFSLPTRRKPETRIKHLRSNETRHVLAFVLGPRHRVRTMSPRPENLYASRSKTLEKMREDQ
jgi:hypothetical protein